MIITLNRDLGVSMFQLVAIPLDQHDMQFQSQIQDSLDNVYGCSIRTCCFFILRVVDSTSEDLGNRCPTSTFRVRNPTSMVLGYWPRYKKCMKHLSMCEHGHASGIICDKEKSTHVFSSQCIVGFVFYYYCIAFYSFTTKKIFQLWKYQYRTRL